ncbi:MAG: hypothetical protein Q8O83_04565 [bacterium]|nr:hypothetical protein [bacterium]
MQKISGNTLVIVLIIAAIIVAGVLYDTYIKKDTGPSLEELRTDFRTHETALYELNGSNVAGTAFLVGTETNTEITLMITDLEEGAVRPAHIHSGTCADLGAVVYPLSPVENGLSETHIDVSFFDLVSEGVSFAINLHDSPDNLSEWVACGNMLDTGPIPLPEEALIEE